MTIYLQVGHEPLEGNFDLSVRSWDSKPIELGFLTVARLVQPSRTVDRSNSGMEW
jgi:hypothetical protein